MATIKKLHSSYHSLRLCSECHKEIYEVEGYFYGLNIADNAFILCDECGAGLEEIEVLEKRKGWEK